MADVVKMWTICWMEGIVLRGHKGTGSEGCGTARVFIPGRLYPRRGNPMHKSGKKVDGFPTLSPRWTGD